MILELSRVADGEGPMGLLDWAIPRCASGTTGRLVLEELKIRLELEKGSIANIVFF